MAAETNKTKQKNNNKTITMNNRITNYNKTCSCTACGSHMHCIVGPSRTQLTGVDPSRIQRYEISLHSLRCDQKKHFSTGIKSLQWIGCVNLELCSYFRNCPFFKQNLYMDETPTTAKVTQTGLLIHSGVGSLVIVFPIVDRQTILHQDLHVNPMAFTLSVVQGCQPCWAPR